MDRDAQLIAYLDTKLESLVSHLDVKFEGIDRRFEETQEQIRETRDQVRKNRTEIRENRTEIHKNQTQIRKNQTQIRQIQTQTCQIQTQLGETQLLVEDLGSRIQTVAEGHSSLDSKMDRIYDEIKTERQMVQSETGSAQRHLRERVERLEAAG